MVYNVAMTGLTIAGFAHSKSPRSENEIPFWCSVAFLLLVALIPPPPMIGMSGPLCSPCTLYGALERILRAFLFSNVYSTLVYSAAPISSQLVHTLTCTARSLAASCWILGASFYTLPLVAVQMFVIIYYSVRKDAFQYEEAVSNLESGHNHFESSEQIMASAAEHDILPCSATDASSAGCMGTMGTMGTMGSMDDQNQGVSSQRAPAPKIRFSLSPPKGVPTRPSESDMHQLMVDYAATQQL